MFPQCAQKKSSCRNPAGDAWCNHEVIPTTLLMSRNIKCSYLCRGWGTCNDTVDTCPCIRWPHFASPSSVWSGLHRRGSNYARKSTDASLRAIDLLQHLCKIPKWLVKYLIFILKQNHKQTSPHSNCAFPELITEEHSAFWPHLYAPGC